jgi:N-acetylmuramoyl-L-alanine amidase
VTSFESVEGRALAERIADLLAGDPPGRSPQVSGVRLPVLRETRMPAVLCVLGPARRVHDRAVHEAATVVHALDAWLAHQS